MNSFTDLLTYNDYSFRIYHAPKLNSFSYRLFRVSSIHIKYLKGNGIKFTI